MEDDDYDYLASEWDPTHMSRDEYKEFVSYLRDKGIISDEEKRYLDGERIATSGQSWVSFDYPTPVEYGDENVLSICDMKLHLFMNIERHTQNGERI